MTSHKKAQKAQKLNVTFVPFGALWFVPFVDSLVRSVAFVALGRRLIGVLFRRSLIFPIVGYDLRRLLWRPFILVFALRKCTGGHHAEHR